ncbi:hypothetical protein CSB37_02620 [bacterium DOLZORAL124_38_8]|nr:MAG: hypothetical protein CSB37_02620 [bacterium DOLZORAL124_38_8]
MFEFLMASILAFKPLPSVSRLPDFERPTRVREISPNELKPIRALNDKNNPDGDLFVGKNDLCPKVPGRDFGCPTMKLRQPSVSKNWVLTVSNKKYEAKEQQEIRLGDEIFVGFQDKKNKKVFPITKPVKITE